MKRKLRVVLSNEKTIPESFLVAIIPALPIPEDLPKIEAITNCAVIAANDDEGNGIYSYVHLEDDEKQYIGDALSNACAKLNTWYWCELYDNIDINL